MRDVREQIYIAGATAASCLIEGETGTGKELVAHAIHNVSMRKIFPFVKVNCSAIPENLMESEFFGYEEGSFTGGVKGGKAGKFEKAHLGSMFLDEINAMSLKMQPKLLRALQEKEIERVGGTGEHSCQRPRPFRIQHASRLSRGAGCFSPGFILSSQYHHSKDSASAPQERRYSSADSIFYQTV